MMRTELWKDQHGVVEIVVNCDHCNVRDDVSLCCENTSGSVALHHRAKKLLQMNNCQETPNPLCQRL